MNPVENGLASLRARKLSNANTIDPQLVGGFEPLSNLVTLTRQLGNIDSYK